MKRYDVVVVGAGDVGLGIAFQAASEGLRTALIDKGSVGGTCVNYGCVPSKTLIHTADRIMEFREAMKVGIRANIIDVDFKAVMERMRSIVTNSTSSIRKALEDSEHIDFIAGECHFIDEHTLQAGNEKIRGKKIFIASGSRPAVPPLRGLDAVPYLTNESVLKLEKKPGSMTIIGGGYIGVEYGHFFSAMGTKVTIVQRNARLLPHEEPEISEALKNEMEKHIALYVGVETTEVRKDANGYTVVAKDIGTGGEKGISAETLFIAAGRISNADLLKVEHAGIETDRANFIRVDDYLRTNRKYIWALGDAIGRAMFTHAGDKEAEIAWQNARQRKKIKMDFGSVPHAVFTWPQIASVGLTEEEARKDHEILVGRAMYSDTVMGEAMAEQEGFAKAIVEKGTKRILGFHIIGPHAAMLIQEVVNAVIHKSAVQSITGCMHIFPALSDLIPETLNNLE
ncbi:MAG: dihydrolipoyl dehydrogenase family protein [bacterium]